MPRAGLQRDKDVLVGCIDVASNVDETPQEFTDTIRAAGAELARKAV